MAVHDRNNNEPKRRRRWGGVFACCTEVNVHELGANEGSVRKPGRKRVLSGFTWKKKKRTVPIETANKTKDCETETMMMTARRFSDGNKENNCDLHAKTDGCSDQITTQEVNPHRSILSSKSANASSTAPIAIHDLASENNNHLSKSAPLCSSAAHFKLRSNNSSSPQSSRYATPDASPSALDASSSVLTGDTDSLKLGHILTVAALLVLLFGRGFAVVSMCVYFYVVSRFREDLVQNQGGRKKGNDGIDLNSDRHKRTVVLRGFLERPKKKPVISVDLQSSSS